MIFKFNFADFTLIEVIVGIIIGIFIGFFIKEKGAKIGERLFRLLFVLGISIIIVLILKQTDINFLIIILTLFWGGYFLFETCHYEKKSSCGEIKCENVKCNFMIIRLYSRVSYTLILLSSFTTLIYVVINLIWKIRGE